jgi:hypothetical protein
MNRLSCYFERISDFAVGLFALDGEPPSAYRIFTINLNLERLK